MAGGGGLVAAAGELAALVAEGGQAAEVDGDLVGLAGVQRQRRPAHPVAEEVAAQEGGDPAGAGDDLDDPGQDLLLQGGQRLAMRRPGGRIGGIGWDGRSTLARLFGNFRLIGRCGVGAGAGWW